MKSKLLIALASASLVALSSNDSLNANETDNNCIPQGALIQSATMTVLPKNTPNSNVTVHQITAPWNEMTVTYNSFADAFAFSPESSFITDTLAPKQADLTYLVDAWLSGAVENYGVLLNGDTGLADFHSSESDVVANRPSLEICYDLDGGTSCTVIQRTGPALDQETVNDTTIWAALADINIGDWPNILVGYNNNQFKPALVRFNISECPVYNPGTGTPGYWKNHPEAWPVEEITVGGVVLSKDEAIWLLSLPEKGDKSYTVYRGFVAATLNVILGNDSTCVSDSLSAADAWLVDNPPGSGIKGRASEWKSIQGNYLQLDQYNNGLLCAPARD